jgi:hypothetical protein
VSAPTTALAGYDTTIACKGRNSGVGAYFTDAPVVPSLGYGGHPVGARPKKKALTVWEGAQPFQMAIPLLLSKGPSGSVENMRERLELMATAPPQTPNLAKKPQPFTVQIQNRVGKLPLPGSLMEGIGPGSAKWWIEDLVWGAEKRDRHNELYYKEVVVTLLETVVDTILQARGAHPYKIRKGDTWAKIAARELGDQERQFELREMNGNKSDAQLAKMVGKAIRIPQSI